ncbi:hypothetical protein E3C22_00655 [Jiella endophytica]|uniref:Uncharacterized protein n=1 Tax=Jiella endophytica TaxID=2558362 RepID=A0A4Y8RF76_9HYPH|nr:hypothetical protein [Jiella endophytica]TFF20724.1 hypothetical protein E3C22_17695 [Jiella endophytica]TFF27025.1 hypothetical protein E3C22_00655 [Jiella endophytica]
MAPMMSSLTDALSQASLDDEKARKAAEEAADCAEKLNQSDEGFTALDRRLKSLPVNGRFQSREDAGGPVPSPDKKLKAAWPKFSK